MKAYELLKKYEEQLDMVVKLYADNTNRGYSHMEEIKNEFYAMINGMFRYEMLEENEYLNMYEEAWYIHRDKKNMLASMRKAS